MSEPEPPILAISPANDLMHVGPRHVVLSHVTAEEPDPAADEEGTDWEFYDAAGRVLTTAEEDGEPVLVPEDPDATPGRAARQILVARVDVALAHAQLRLDRRLAELEAAGEPIPPSQRTRMVRVQGELADVLTALDALQVELDPTPQDPHSGSWWHNFWGHWR